MLISQPESRFYLSGYTGHDLPPRDSAGYLMIGKGGARLLTDPRTSEQATNDVLDDCFMHIAKNELRVGRSEKEIALAVEQYLQGRGYTTSFPSIVASGPNASMPLAVPTDRKIQEREPITIDIGAQVNG